ncbi:MAG: hypothetical protein KJ622_09005 [Alphaproteobacteria bacterium]|nr:hypothetical protein [Alphaproteobacteria bacterium]
MNVKKGKPRYLCAHRPAIPLQNRTSNNELLVGYGFRWWLTGLRSRNPVHWQDTWRLYSNSLDTKSARLAVDCLAKWAVAADAHAHRRLQIAGLHMNSFSRDETLAIAMIAASQHSTCPAMRACAFALLETPHVDEVVHHAETFAVVLRAQGCLLSPHAIVNANDYMGGGPGAMN